MMIESNIPIAHILKLDMDHRLNEHGILNMKVVIKPDMQNDFLHTNYLGQNSRFFTTSDPELSLVFSGKINKVDYKRQDDVITASIGIISYSIELDEHLMRRSFQNINIKFNSLLDLIIKDTKARFIWQIGSDKELGKPFVQYDETDWEFVKRLASYFNRLVQVSMLSEHADFYFGVRTGENRQINEAAILEQGISDVYYKNGGYESNAPRSQYYYLKIRHREAWQIGDFANYRNSKLTVIRTQAAFEKGELIFIHTLGADGYLYQRIIYSHQLIGLNLQGIIRRTEKESITIELDIDRDHDEQAHYLWSWTPEVGNLNYIMPEVDSRVILTFPTNDEQDAFASRLLRTNSTSGIYEQIENKQIVTAEDKTIGLYPNQLMLAGRNFGVSVSLDDQEGIHFNSNKNIRMRASREIQLRGKKVTIVAPNQVLMQTAQSNIDVATNFNFFAPKGVNTTSNLPSQPRVKAQAEDGMEDQNHWPLSFGAIGALPRSIGVDMNQNPITNAAIGVLPRMTGGQTAIVMNEMMNGTDARTTSYPKAFSSMGSFSMKGGNRVPKEEIEETEEIDSGMDL